MITFSTIRSYRALKKLQFDLKAASSGELSKKYHTLGNTITGKVITHSHGSERVF